MDIPAGFATRRPKRENMFYLIVCLLSCTTATHAALFRNEDIRIGEFTKFQPGKALNNHVIKTTQVSSKMDCVLECLSADQCVSYNYQETSSTNSHTCELNNNTFDRSKVENLKTRVGFVYGESVLKGNQNGPCATSPCENNGKCINVDENVYECVCQVSTIGDHCEQWKDDAKDYMLTFPQKSTEDFLSELPLKSSQVSRLTICVWLNYVVAGWHTFLSYSASNIATMLAIRCHNTGKCEFIVNTVTSEVYTSPLNDGSWHHLCFSWDNTQGIVKFYVDGVIRSTKKDVSSSLVISGTGKLIIGQLQSSPVELTFNASDSFMGSMYGLNMWDAVKSPSQILSLSKQCISEPGNLVDWRVFAVKESYGVVNRAMPSVCAFNVSKTANFESSTGEKYIKMPFKTSLREVTVCFWSRRKWKQKCTAFNYYSETSGHVLRWTFFGATEHNVFVAGVKTTIYSYPHYDDLWHHYCYTWESTGGQLVVFIDGIVMYNASSVDRAKTIEETGVLVIGQRMTNPTSVSADSYYTKYLAHFNIWNASLSGHVITAMGKTAGRDLGNELNWNDVVYGGQVFGGLSLTPTNDVTLNASNSDFYLDFGSIGSVSNYVQLQKPIPSVTKFLACYWVWPTSAGGIFGYSTPALADTWAAYVYNDYVGFCINEAWKYSGYITAFGNGWSLICWKWRNTDGKTELYKDGKLLMSLTGFQTGHTIPGGGIFILGHELDSHGGGFQANQALTGYLGHLNIWDQFEGNQVAMEEMTRGASHFEGNLVTWSSLRDKIYGTITVVETSSCTLADFLTQQLRDKWCKDNVTPGSSCSGLYTLFDRDINNNGRRLRCYCKNTLFQNSTGLYTYVYATSEYYTKQELRLIKNL